MIEHVIPEGPWWPLGDDDAFWEGDGHAEREAANLMHSGMTGGEGFGKFATTVSISGHDEHNRLLVSMTCIRRPTELLLIIWRTDDPSSYFTDQPPEPPSPD